MPPGITIDDNVRDQYQDAFADPATQEAVRYSTSGANHSSYQQCISKAYLPVPRMGPPFLLGFIALSTCDWLGCKYAMARLNHISWAPVSAPIDKNIILILSDIIEVRNTYWLQYDWYARGAQPVMTAIDVISKLLRLYGVVQPEEVDRYLQVMPIKWTVNAVSENNGFGARE
jgi:hypothetical protein